MEEDIFKRHTEFLYKEEREMIEKNSELISRFKLFAKGHGIELGDECFEYSHSTGITAKYPNIVSILCSTYVKDKEGLLSFYNLCNDFNRKRFTPGMLHGDNFILMASNYFRRSFHPENNFAPRFIEFFWSLKDKNIDPSISIDFDRVRIDMTEFGPMELDNWYGPKFSENIAQIADGIVKLRPPLELAEHRIEFIFRSAYSLDILWTTKGSIRTFQAEEFKMASVTVEKDGVVYHPVRYVHAEFDTNLGYFRHFDGAIHFYTPQEYYQRRDSDFNYNSKSGHQIKTLSEKLFKLNGIVSIDMWREFTCHFMSGNPLIFEYFEGDYPKEIQEILTRIKNLNGM